MPIHPAFRPQWIKGPHGGDYYVTATGAKVYRSAAAVSTAPGRRAMFHQGLPVAHATSLHPAALSGSSSVHQGPGAPAPHEEKWTDEMFSKPKGEEKEKKPKKEKKAKGAAKVAARSIAHIEPVSVLGSHDFGKDPAAWAKMNSESLSKLSNSMSAALGGKATTPIGTFKHDDSHKDVLGYFNKHSGTIALNTYTVGKINDAIQHGLNRSNVEGVRVLTHEIMHAVSQTGSKYEHPKMKKRPHVALEEATTEITGQHYTTQVAQKIGIKVNGSSHHEGSTENLFTLGAKQTDGSYNGVFLNRPVAYLTHVQKFANMALLSRGIDVRAASSDPRSVAQKGYAHDEPALHRVIVEAAMETKKRGGSFRMNTLAKSLLNGAGVSDAELKTPVGRRALILMVKETREHLGAPPNHPHSHPNYIRDAIDFNKRSVERFRSVYTAGGTPSSTEG